MIVKKRICETLKVRTSTNKINGSDHMLSYKNNEGILVHNHTNLLGRHTENNSRKLN